MDKLFSSLKKTLIGILFIVFGFVTTYIPINQPGHIPLVEAGAAGGGSTEFTQILNNVELMFNTGFNLETSISTVAEYAKSYGLDKIAWELAKQALANMTNDIVGWIRNDFNGKPGFITDLRGMLEDTANRVFDDFINDVAGGAFAFLCDPFSLDIQTALEIEYYNDYQPAPACTITDVVDNVDNFINESEHELSSDGWDNFFVMTSNPVSNTPLGNHFTLQEVKEEKIAEAQENDLREYQANDGFRSQKICEEEIDPGTGVGKQTCTISTPGKIVQEVLSNALDSERQSILEADEFNEVLSSMFTTISNEFLLQKSQGLLDF